MKAIKRIQNENGSYRPDVPLWVLIIGGWFFRFSWVTLSNRTLFHAIDRDNNGVPLTLWQRWHMFVLQNWAYWDQYDELSAADKGAVKSC